jgi:YihY family inner membrane protein
MNWITRAIDEADRFQSRRPWTAVPVAVFRKFQDDQAGYLAALICYFGFVAIFPMLLIFVTVLDSMLGSDPTLRRDLLNSVLMQYPVIGETIDNNLGTVTDTGFPLSIGIVVLLLGTRGVAFAMQNALCTVWEIPRHQRPDFWVRALFGLGLVLAIGLGLVVTSFLSGLAGGAGHVLSGFVAHAGAVAISLTMNVGVFWVSFRLATLRKVPWRNLWLGAVLAAVIWQVLQVAGGYVVTHQLHRASALYGTFGVVLGLLGWLYLQATVTLYCAEVDVVLARHHWPRSLRGPGATEPDGQEAGPAAAGRRVPVDIPHQGNRPQQAGQTPVDSMEAAQAGASQPEAGQSKALESKTASTRAVDSKAGNSEPGQGASAA